MSVSSDQSRSPFDAFLSAFGADIENAAVRPLADYLVTFPGDDAAIEREYRAAMDRALASSQAALGEPSADRIAHYKLLRQIGRGGQATVYLAEDTKLHRQVALKVLDPGRGSDQTRLERFRREAAITSRLDHPAICAVYEAGEERGSLWIAMRYVEGDSLATRISTAKEPAASGSFMEVASSPLNVRSVSEGEGPKTPPRGPRTWPEISRVVTLFEETARALHAAHSAGVIHRDVKPGNLMVTRDDRPVILDFGLAQEGEDFSPSMIFTGPSTVTGDLIGTPPYMSPEQIAAQRIKLDRRTDIYSLGISLFESLTLRRPFEAETLAGLYQAILTKAPPDLRELNPAVPDDLRVVIATAIEKDRDRRYQTALALAEELRRVRMREPIKAKPAGPLLRFRRWAQRNPVLATAVAGLFAVLTVGLAISTILLKHRAAALADYERLADRSRLESLIREARDLWPGRPSDTARLQSWVDRASDLGSRVVLHQRILEELRTSATFVPDDATASQSTSQPSSTRGTWRFEAIADQFKYDTTEDLVDELLAFVYPKGGLLAEGRWRLALAREASAGWQRAIDEISNREVCPAYEGLRIVPQKALMPIARDPTSRLWEFVHVQSAEPGVDPIPGRGPDGRLLVTKSTGLVFVLLPGGTFRMGAVKPDHDHTLGDPNVDPQAEPDESPITTVTLAPFFMSKYEMTQGQWSRTAGNNPSASPDSNSVTRPVDSVCHSDCDALLAQLSLVLPTEAQWEYAARGGTTATRWTRLGAEDPDTRAEGVIHSAGWSPPNPFGLHEVLGNVAEWCLDEHLPYSDPVAPSDGLRRSAHESRFLNGVVRGGSWNDDWSIARSSSREVAEPGHRAWSYGVRPARSLDR